MKKLLILFLTLPLFLVSFSSTTFAAQIIGEENVSVSSSAANLSDLYLFGGNVRLEAPVENDLTTAGGTLDLKGSTTGSVMAAGGNLTIGTAIGNTLRAAGGNLTIDSTVARDALVAGGQIRFSENARIDGDLLVAGGQITIDAPVGGKILVNGGDVVINSIVGGNVEGNIGSLRLGPNAVINGDLRYTAPDRAEVATGGQIVGRHDFTESRAPEHAERGVEALITAGSIYKLVVDVLIGLLFVFFFRKLLQSMFSGATAAPVKTIGIGFAVLILTPIASLFLLLLFLLGIISFALYLFILLTSVVIGKLLVGWYVLRFYENRRNKTYTLDYRAAIAGPIVMLALYFIPILGWLVAFLIYLIAVGTVSRTLLTFAQEQNQTKVASRRASPRIV